MQAAREAAAALGRQCGRVVRASDLKSGDPEFASRSDSRFNSSAAFLYSQLVCLLPVGILNLLSLFRLFVSLALKSPSGEWSIKYVCDVRVLFWLITYYKHAHNLVLLKFTIKQLEIHFSLKSSCLTFDRYQHEIEYKCISPSKITANA